MPQGFLFQLWKLILICSCRLSLRSPCWVRYVCVGHRLSQAMQRVLSGALERTAFVGRKVNYARDYLKLEQIHIHTFHLLSAKLYL